MALSEYRKANQEVVSYSLFVLQKAQINCFLMYAYMALILKFVTHSSFLLSSASAAGAFHHPCFIKDDATKCSLIVRDTKCKRVSGASPAAAFKHLDVASSLEDSKSLEMRTVDKLFDDSESSEQFNPGSPITALTPQQEQHKSLKEDARKCQEQLNVSSAPAEDQLWKSFPSFELGIGFTDYSFDDANDDTMVTLMRQADASIADAEDLFVDFEVGSDVFSTSTSSPYQECKTYKGNSAGETKNVKDDGFPPVTIESKKAITSWLSREGHLPELFNVLDSYKAPSKDLIIKDPSLRSASSIFDDASIYNFKDDIVTLFGKNHSSA